MIDQAKMNKLRQKHYLTVVKEKYLTKTSKTAH